MVTRQKHLQELSEDEQNLVPVYARSAMEAAVPKYKSRPGNQIVGQYYNFVRLGRAGYTRVMESMRDTALYLSREIEKLGPFEHLSRGDTIPVFAFAMKEARNYTVFDLSDRLREHGWQVPAYTMPPKVDDLADMLLADLKSAVDHFESQPGYKSPHEAKRGKVHKNC